MSETLKDQALESYSSRRLLQELVARGKIRTLGAQKTVSALELARARQGGFEERMKRSVLRELALMMVEEQMIDLETIPGSNGLVAFRATARLID